MTVILRGAETRRVAPMTVMLSGAETGRVAESKDLVKPDRKPDQAVRSNRLGILRLGDLRSPRSQ
jgi:hypothetical protein